MPTSLGPAEIIVIVVIALIVLGPKRLPDAARQVGKALTEMRRWTRDVQSEVRSVIDTELSAPVLQAPDPADPNGPLAQSPPALPEGGSPQTPPTPRPGTDQP